MPKIIPKASKNFPKKSVKISDKIAQIRKGGRCEKGVNHGYYAKKMKLTSVDLTRAGANQKADICLYKSAAMVDEEQQERKVGKSMIKIDKSRFDADELEMYNALIEKAKVELEEDEEEFEEPAKPTRKRKFLNRRIYNLSAT